MVIEIDALNHLYNHGNSRVIDRLLNYRIEVDGKRADLTDLQILIPTIALRIKDNTQWVDQLSWHQRVEKYAEIFWFRKAPLRSACGLDWRLPPAVREKIRSGEPNPARTERLSAEQVRRLAILTI